MHRTIDLITSAHSDGFICIVGGDFNAQLGVGPRGELLRQLSTICHLRIANEIVDDMNTSDHWTFESSMGERRQIDFILSSARIPIIAVEATRAIDMGSDHRAVKCVFEIGIPIIRKKRRKRIRTWKPREVFEYHECLDNSIRNCDYTSTDHLQQIIADCADKCSSKVIDHVKKPWLTGRFHELLRTRRSENCRVERSRLSKLITRELRAGIRAWKT